MGLNIVLSLTDKKLDAFKFDGVAESDNTAGMGYIFTHKPKSERKTDRERYG